MSAGRTIWWPKDAAWWRREWIVELGEEFGADGPAVIDWLSCEAKVQNDEGRVSAGMKTAARGSFVDVVTVGHVLSRSVLLGLLEDFEEREGRFECRISGWRSDNERGGAALRKRAQRERDGSVEPGSPPDGTGQDGTDRDTSRPVTPGHERVENRTTTEKASPSPPTPIEEQRARRLAEQVQQVFERWLTATARPAARTKLSPKRKRCIEKALASYGLPDCLAAVTNIGADAWARGANERNHRFDDIPHALGNAERLERWRDARPRTEDPAASRDATRARRAAALAEMTGGAA